eukprot:symbB.v1.2.039788.t1/scaffold6779.1/size16909/2
MGAELSSRMGCQQRWLAHGQACLKVQAFSISGDPISPAGDMLLDWMKNREACEETVPKAERNFSQGGRKHCWWKIDVQVGASSRQQDGSDAGPESFELRVFLQGLRQEQHRWGAAWGVQNRFNQRFCIETVLTQMWLSFLKRKVGESIAGGKLMSRLVRAADNKMAVMLDRNPLNSESFCRA